jgi:hypothetical protein
MLPDLGSFLSTGSLGHHVRELISARATNHGDPRISDCLDASKQTSAAAYPGYQKLTSKSHSFQFPILTPAVIPLTSPTLLAD